MFSQGVTATTLTEVRAATGTSNSQLYHYFTDKSELVQAVIAFQTDQFLRAQGPVLDELDSWDGLLAWSQLMIAAQRDQDRAGGCSVGSLASELADNDEGSRLALVEAFERWQAHLVKGLVVMRERGDLAECADPEELATALMTAIEGGLVLSQVTRDVRPLEVALKSALGYVRTFLTQCGHAQSGAVGGELVGIQGQ
jgi:TetR/AcrR family transcriptional regulator, transcriptional repressor for nem operon